MNGTVNGFGLNGAALPNWVVRAVVVAVAAATVNVTQVRTTYAACYGDAVVNVSLTQTHTIQARALAAAACTSNLEPHVVYAGSSSKIATAFGAGAVRRDVFGEAGGDARATGEALTAQAIGAAQATSASSVLLAQAHLIRPGRANVLCGSNQVISAGDVKRYTGVSGALGTITYTRAEASTKLGSEAFYRHNGYVPLATSGSTGSVPQDRIKIIATLGSFSFADSVSSSRSFVIFHGEAIGTGVNTANPVASKHIYYVKASTQASATGVAVGVRNVLPTEVAQAAASALSPKSHINYASAAHNTALASLVRAIYKRTAYGSLTNNLAVAYLVQTTYGTQFFGLASNTSGAVANTPASLQRFAGASSVQAVATVISPVYATQHYAYLAASAQASIVSITPLQSHQGRVYALASGLVGRAYPVTNSDVLAPDERYMFVSQEMRDMTVFTEDREMKVAA